MRTGTSVLAATWYCRRRRFPARRPAHTTYRHKYFNPPRKGAEGVEGARGGGHGGVFISLTIYERMKRRRAHEKMHTRGVAVDPKHPFYRSACFGTKRKRRTPPALVRERYTEVLQTCLVCVCISELRARGPRSGSVRPRARAREIRDTPTAVARCGAMRYKTRGPPAASRAARHYLSRPPRARRRQLCAGTADLAARIPAIQPARYHFIIPAEWAR